MRRELSHTQLLPITLSSPRRGRIERAGRPPRPPDSAGRCVYPHCPGADSASAPRFELGYPEAMPIRIVTRRFVLAGLATACAGAAAMPFLARARATRLGYPVPRSCGRPRSGVGAAAGLYAWNAGVDRRAVLHAVDAAPRQPARAGLGRRAAGPPGPGADAGLPARGGRRGRPLALRRPRPLRQQRLPLSRPSVHRRGRRVPVRDHPPRPLHRPDAAFPRQGAGRADARADHPALLSRTCGGATPGTSSFAKNCCCASTGTGGVWRTRFDFVLAPV